MDRGYQIFPRNRKFRDNFNTTFGTSLERYPCRGCEWLEDNECAYDGDCIEFEKEKE